MTRERGTSHHGTRLPAPYLVRHPLQELQHVPDGPPRGPLGPVQHIDVPQRVHPVERPEYHARLGGDRPARKQREPAALGDERRRDGELVDAVDESEGAAGDRGDRVERREDREAVVDGDPRLARDLRGGERVVRGEGMPRGERDVERFAQECRRGDRGRPGRA